jgi:hypothetical protein
MKSVPQEKNDQDARSERILELQKKIRDNAYLDNAVQRMAFVMSKQLVEGVPVKRIL